MDARALADRGLLVQNDCDNAASDLLNPDCQFAVSDLRNKPTLIPAAAGIYAWWFSKMPPGVCIDRTKMIEGRHLLYVGIAPKKPSATEEAGKRTLRDRLLNHCRGPIGSSTLRRTLATLLASDLALRIGRLPSRRIGMPAEDETKLTDWMDEHARLNWVTSTMPWEEEDRLIQGAIRLPLNIRGNSDPFAKKLSKLRSQAGQVTDTEP
jgi:hypothetical protein